MCNTQDYRYLSLSRSVAIFHGMGAFSRAVGNSLHVASLHDYTRAGMIAGIG